VSIVSDILVTLLLIPFLLRQNLNNRKKAGLCGVFLLGLFTTVCSILRYVQIDRVAYGDGNSTMLVLWGTVEFNVGVSCFYSIFVAEANGTTERGFLSAFPSASSCSQGQGVQGVPFKSAFRVV
jgi:hypothetical protein